jgi:hypothetical protein
MDLCVQTAELVKLIPIFAKRETDLNLETFRAKGKDAIPIGILLDF